MSETVDPIEQRRQRLERQFSDARRALGELRGRLSFSSVTEQVTRRQSELSQHAESLQKLRGRGYIWRPDLEQKLEIAGGEVAGLVAALREEARQAEYRLRSQLERVEGLADRVRGDVLDDAAEISNLDSAVEGLKKAVDESEDKLEALAKPFIDRVSEVQKKLKDLHWTMDVFADASYELQPEENPVAVAEALWTDAPGDDDGVPGRLIFTDLRVRFEQKEEVVTKKRFFFFAAEKELQQGLVINEPLGHLLASDDSTRGMVFKDQLLTFGWHERARAPRQTTFKLSSGNAKEWDEIVEMLMSGDLIRHRVGEAAASNVGTPVNWPQNCAGCGAVMPAPVKGQTVAACPYCHTEHQITLA
jgi:hypothetical protein